MTEAEPRDRVVTVVRPGPLTTVQDLGRLGQGALGIGHSGACDRSAHRLANALVGNVVSAATLEATLGGLVLEAGCPIVVATTGARCPGAIHNAPVYLVAGARLVLGAPQAGLRTYVAVRGGFHIAPVLGSKSTDVLSGLGPPPCTAGDALPVGRAVAALPCVDLAAVAEPSGWLVTLRVSPGPRRDWFGDDAWDLLLTQTYEVTADSNRVGLRLDGAPLRRRRIGELPSEGMAAEPSRFPRQECPSSSWQTTRSPSRKIVRKASGKLCSVSCGLVEASTTKGIPDRWNAASSGSAALEQ